MNAGNGLGPWRSRLIYRLHLSFPCKNEIAFPLTTAELISDFFYNIGNVRQLFGALPLFELFLLAAIWREIQRVMRMERKRKMNNDGDVEREIIERMHSKIKGDMYRICSVQISRIFFSSRIAFYCKGTIWPDWISVRGIIR